MRQPSSSPAPLLSWQVIKNRFHRMFLPSNSLDTVSPTDLLLCFEVLSPELAKERVVELQVQQVRGDTGTAGRHAGRLSLQVGLSRRGRAAHKGGWLQRAWMPTEAALSCLGALPCPMGPFSCSVRRCPVALSPSVRPARRSSCRRMRSSGAARGAIESVTATCELARCLAGREGLLP